MNIAFEVAKASKCLRAKYGSVLVSSDGRIISSGYNGKPRGSLNDSICYRSGLPDNFPRPNCCLHSEVNCIMFSNPLDRIGGTLYVSGIPCTDCALVIAQSGISRVVYYNNLEESGHKGNFDQSFADEYGMKVKFEEF